MMMKLKKNVLLGIALSVFLTRVSATETDFTRYVDPFIGTDYHGHVFLGANVPFGAVQAGPDNYFKGWDWCSGYHYSDSIVVGFSQTHLSGTGCADLGDVLVTPFTGALKTMPGTLENPLSGYASKYDHKDEIARPGYYSLWMKDHRIRAELTATCRVAIHRYTFPQAENAYIAVNLERGLGGYERTTQSHLKRVNDTTYTGYRRSSGWAKDQHCYFALRLSKPVGDVRFFQGGKPLEKNASEGGLTGVFCFKTCPSEAIVLKIGISSVSEANALNNIETEASGHSFEHLSRLAHDSWNRELGKITVKSRRENDLRTFYTALYHSFFAPVVFQDCNGDYRGADGKIHTNPGYTNYSVFSLWDTYRATHPLFTIVQPERVGDMVRSMLSICDQQGKLPVWPLMSNETNCMVGYSAIPVLADAYLKGLKGFDPAQVLLAMKTTTNRDEGGLKYLKEKGYIPADKEYESVSKALEYCFSDWCVAQTARKLGKKDDCTSYMGRAASYRQYFDPNTRFIRAKLDNGRFREPFDPFQSIHSTGDYTEGNAWQYTWLVPHDVEGLIGLMGGDEAFTSKLDSLFVVSGDMGERASWDISGLVGQYAQGNEPCHHVAYLYAYSGSQWKTAEKVRYLLRNLYTDKPDGLCGNEDCGQMSAWYVLSSMGFYPVNAANSEYVFGSPLFDEVTLKLPGNKRFVVSVLNNSEKNLYIQAVRWNGKPYTRSFITYRDIMRGGTIEFVMGETPNRQFGSSLSDRPVSNVCR